MSSSARPGTKVVRSAATARAARPLTKLARLIGVGADVADAAAGAGALRVGAPRRLLVARLLERRRQPVLRVLGLHDAERRRASPSATISRACRTIG